jgi:hypothetical protein
MGRIDRRAACSPLDDCTAEGLKFFTSATNHSAVRRREFLIGFPSCSMRLRSSRALTTDFLRRKVGLERLTAHFYLENTHAILGGEKFGLQQQGLLRDYLRRPNGSCADF